jgi:riboflavin synthase
MFTGLIEEVGVIAAVEPLATGDAFEGGCRFTVQASKVLQDMTLGDSVAVDGACMTVIGFDAQGFSFEASPESLSKTNFSAFTPGRRVNLERPLTPSSRIGGHYVTGHVDGLAQIVSIEPEGNSWIYTFEVPEPTLAELLIPKGSVAVLGISLTVNSVSHNRFSVAIIPHTRAHTNLSDYRVGDLVNIETDLLGKYVRRLLRGSKNESRDEEVTPPSTAELEDGSVVDVPTLVPALNALKSGVSSPNIRTGSWFCHDPETR